MKLRIAAAAALLALPAAAAAERHHDPGLSAEAPPASGPLLALPTTLPPEPPTTATTRATAARVTTTHAPRPAAPRAVSKPGPCGRWLDTIARYFAAAKVAKACAVMQCESGGNPTARYPKPPWPSGLFQFIPPTWRATTGRSDQAYQAPPDVQVAAAAKLQAQSGWSQWQCA